MIPNLGTPLFKRVREYQESRALKRSQAQFLRGEQDQIDLISYESLEEAKTYLQVGDAFVRTLSITGYPYVATTGWLSGLIRYHHSADISYHIEQIDAQLALPKLTRKITELESNRRVKQQQGRIVGAEILDPLESARELKDKIVRGQEKLFQVSIYISLFEESIEKLDKSTALLHGVLNTKLFTCKVATFQQIAGFHSVLPRGQNLLKQTRNLDSSSAALTFPFTSSELVQESGILYGINKSNNSLVIVDRFSLHNANSIMFAQSGSGKSYTAKVEIFRQLLQNTKVIIIDPEREYQQMCEHVEGTHITISASADEHINPFDFSVSATGKSGGLTEHIQDLFEVISLLVGGMSAKEAAILDTALVTVYKQHGFDRYTDTRDQESPLKYPLLGDLYSVLEKMNATTLTQRLRKYIHGSLSNVFNSQTNIDLDNQLIVFDIKDVPGTIRDVMMVVIANYVYNQVKSDPHKRLLVIDEAWMLLEHEESARFLSGLTRRARKYFLGVSLISQQADDFLQNRYGKAIASQASLRILMRQDTTTIDRVSSEFKLSEYERKFLLTCDRGEGILLADQHHVSIKVVASEKEHPLITTDPHEVFALK